MFKVEPKDPPRSMTRGEWRKAHRMCRIMTRVLIPEVEPMLCAAIRDMQIYGSALVRI